jgi:hypothetical protein
MKSPRGHHDIYQALFRLERWIEQAEWKAYDPFDGLSSPFARFCTCNRPFLKQLWQQGVRRFPINLRPLLSIKPSTSTKAMGFFAQGYITLSRTYNAPGYLEKARFCLQWLTANPSPGFVGFSWGNHFDYQHRAGNIPKGSPTIVWTGLIGHAFLDAYELLAEKSFLAAAQQACYFIVNELGRTEFPDSVYLHYYPGVSHIVHNSNMIGASLLARVHRHAPNEEYLHLSKMAVRFTMRHQLPSGAWYYGVGPQFKWVDSFHTGYVLESLHRYIQDTKDQTFQSELEKGYKFFVETFFQSNGIPRYYDRKTRPLDIQCASQGVQTLVKLRHLHPRSIEIAIQVARWAIANMQDRTGYFYYRKYPLLTNKTPTLHWGQATMLAALALLDEHLTQCNRQRCLETRSGSLL